MQAPLYLQRALRAIDPELRILWDFPRGQFKLVRRAYGVDREEVVRWLCTPEGGVVWPDWFNTIEGVLEAQRWAEVGVANALDDLDGHNAGAERAVEARAADRMHGEIAPMNRFALKKGMRLLGPQRG